MRSMKARRHQKSVFRDLVSRTWWIFLSQSLFCGSGSRGLFLRWTVFTLDCFYVYDLFLRWIFSNFSHTLHKTSSCVGRLADFKVSVHKFECSI